MTPYWKVFLIKLKFPPEYTERKTTNKQKKNIGSAFVCPYIVQRKTRKMSKINVANVERSERKLFHFFVFAVSFCFGVKILMTWENWLHGKENFHLYISTVHPRAIQSHLKWFFVFSSFFSFDINFYFNK